MSSLMGQSVHNSFLNNLFTWVPINKRYSILNAKNFQDIIPRLLEITYIQYSFIEIIIESTWIDKEINIYFSHSSTVKKV